MTVQHLIFDLDDTLYPSSSAMNRAIADNMLNFVAGYFHVTYDEACRLRKDNLSHYGSTLEWLMHEGLEDAEAYFAAVHPDNETDGLQKTPGLRKFLISLGMPMSVLTNAPAEHAERVLRFLDIRDLFDALTDIRDCDLKGKPYPGAFRKALERAGGTLSDTLFIDDQRKYTMGFENIGGISVLVGNGGGAYQTPVIPEICKKSDTISKGRTYRLESIYDLPVLLKQLAEI